MSLMVARVGRVAWTAALFVSLGAWVGLVPACSSNTAAPGCDSTKCKPNNTCVTTAAQGATAGDTKCRFACTHHSDCPLSYHCDANAGGSSPYCVADDYPTTPSTLGVWGASCQANLTKADLTNPACDADQGFKCHALSPTDGSAFCTIYDCTANGDCGDGFYCGTINTLPNATSPKRTDSKATRAVCLPRDYCAPCTTDVDCGLSATGVPQHCTPDSTGAASFCAPECTDDANCRADATCAAYDSFKACAPRAGACVGTGDLCSPCRSDADCTTGYCLQADYSSEKFCTAESGVKCKADTQGNLVSQCPKTTTATGNLIGCTNTVAADGTPLDQCVGLVYKGTGADRGLVLGCWTKH